MKTADKHSQRVIASSKIFKGWTLLSAAMVLGVSACATPQSGEFLESGNPDDLLIIDCLLPGQVRQLGTKVTFLSPRRPIKTSAARCEISGGEYVAFDRADAGTSLRIWLPQAEGGDPQAQTYVGEIFEKGLGVEPDYEVASYWYSKASEQGFTRAQINLGYLYESGLGVKQDLAEAMNLYRQASGIDDGSLEYVSTLEFARRETAKRDTAALRTRVTELAEQLAESEARYRAVKNQVRTDQAMLKELTERTEAKRREVASNYQGDLADTAPETVKTLVEIDLVKDKLESEVSRNNDLSSQLEASRAEIDTLRAGLVADNAEIEQLKKQLAEQVSLIASLEEALEAPPEEADQSETREELMKARNEAEATLQAVSKLRESENEASAELIKELGDAEQRELMLVSVLEKRTQTLSELRRRQVQLTTQYQQSINALQSELELSAAEQTRVAGRLADAEISKQEIESENRELRNRLREQNAQVASREREQLRLAAKVATLSLSEQASQAEKRAAQASTKAANAELALARFEQSRLVTKLVEVQLNARQGELDSAEQLAILERQLAIQQGVVSNRQQQVSVLEESVTAGRAQTQSTPAEEIAQVVAVGPTIEIIEPPVLLTRGPGQIVARKDGTVDVVGRVSPADRLLTFVINGQRQTVNDAGIFSYRSTQTMSSIELAAVDDAGERASVSFNVTQPSNNVVPEVVADQTPRSNEQFNDIEFGNYHAIIIGNNSYNDLGDLRTAEADAIAIDELLRNQYGFTTQLLINATRLDMLTALTEAKDNLTEEDNLIVYYAGHGQIDPDGESGYWLPVDATVSDTDNWVSNSVVTSFLDNIPARQIMVVADSCFSGTLTKASIPRTQETMPAALRKKWLTLMAKRKVRTVLSSGGVKPVYDGTAKHSLFATAFIDQLSRNQGVLEGHQLYSDIRGDVQLSANALGVDQEPQYAAVKYAGHEAGEFLFVAR
ncbi:MAG: caspase family protein [Granulosicoccus sp.]